MRAGLACQCLSTQFSEAAAAEPTLRIPGLSPVSVKPGRGGAVRAFHCRRGEGRQTLLPVRWGATTFLSLLGATINCWFSPVLVRASAQVYSQGVRARPLLTEELWRCLTERRANRMSPR
jgi:hypothetical protein